MKEKSKLYTRPVTISVYDPKTGELVCRTTVTEIEYLQILDDVANNGRETDD